MRRTFTAEIKRLAVALVLEESFTVKEVTKQLDVHENTLYRWIQEVETFGPRAFPGKGSRDYITQNKTVRFQYIKEHQNSISMLYLCQYLQVSRAGYYAFLQHRPSAHELEDEVLKDRIKAIFLEHKRRYGSSRIKICLAKEGLQVSRRRITRLLKCQGLYAKGQRSLQVAIDEHQPKTGLIVHTDNGLQYTGSAFIEMTRNNQYITSNSRKENPYDNAVMESFFKSLKREVLDRARFQTKAKAQIELLSYLENYYNLKRYHSSLGYMTPHKFALENS